MQMERLFQHDRILLTVMAQRKSVTNTNIRFLQKLLKVDERFNEGFTNKPAKHFKCTGKKASLKLWHIQIDTLARYGCILLIVSVQSSLRI